MRWCRSTEGGGQATALNSSTAGEVGEGGESHSQVATAWEEVLPWNLF